MAKTKSGVLYLSKIERKALDVLRYHAKCDLNYGWDGSYGGHDEDDKKAERASQAERKLGQRGIELIDFILDITQ